MARRPLALITIVPLVLAACGGSAAGPAGSPSGAYAASTVPVVALKIGYSNVTADDLALWVAKDAGMFTKNGIDAELVAINGGAQTMAALLAGQLNIGVLGGSEALSARAGDAELTVVATLAPVYPYLFLVGKNIKTFADLKGKKVGVSSIGGSADIATRRVLKVHGLDPEKDVTIVSLGSKAQRTAALLAGSVDAAVDDPPDSVKLEASGYHSIYNLAAQRFPAANTAIVIPTPWLNANRPVVQRVVDSIVQAIAYARKNKDATIAILKKYFGGEYEVGYDIAYEFFLKEVTPSLPYPKVEQFADAKEELGKKNEKVKSFDVAKLLDESFVKSAADRGLDK